ncbi:neuroligin-1 [Trichonephila clavipes]|nr:neuroligin-1 [Trichonephila clavipes]
MRSRLGKGRLTDRMINLITTYYGNAIRQNKTCLSDMRKAVWAVYFHIRSSDEEPLHSFCPVGPNSWCKYQNQVVEGSVETFRHSNKLPGAVMDVIKPVFNDLSQPKLLQKCLGGLFQRAIMQSGSALSPWAIAHDALTYGRQVCETLKCPTKESAPMLDCMRQRPLADIMKVQVLVPEHLSAFGPTVDGIVIPVDPLTPMKEKESLFGKYDLLFGVTKVETFNHLSAVEEKGGIDFNRRDRLLRTLVRNLFTYHMQEIFLTIVNEYTDWTRTVQHPITILDSTMEAMGDGLTVAPLIRTGNYHSKTKGKTYFYVFGYQTENGDYPQRHGAIIGEDLPYLFGAPLVGGLAHFRQNYSKPEIALSEAVMSYWINFAKSGLVVKITDAMMPCHGFDLHTVEDPSFIGDRCTLNVSRLERSIVGMVWNIAEAVPLQCHLRHFTMAQNCEFRHQQPSRSFIE